MTEFRKTLEILLVVGLVAWLAVTFTKPEDARIKNAEAIAFTLATAYRGERGITDSVIRVARTAEWRLTVERRATRIQRDSLAETLDSARTVLADTNATVDELRTTLVGVTERASALVLQVDVLTAQMDSVLALHERERTQWMRERAASDSLLAAKDSVISAYRAVNTCKAGPVPCPTRTQAFVGGGIVVVIGAAVVKFVLR